MIEQFITINLKINTFDLFHFLLQCLNTQFFVDKQPFFYSNSLLSYLWHHLNKIGAFVYLFMVYGIGNHGLKTARTMHKVVRFINDSRKNLVLYRSARCTHWLLAFRLIHSFKIEHIRPIDSKDRNQLAPLPLNPVYTPWRYMNRRYH